MSAARKHSSLKRHCPHAQMWEWERGFKSWLFTMPHGASSQMKTRNPSVRSCWLGVEPSQPLAAWLRWEGESWGVFAVPLSGACSGFVTPPAFTELSFARGRFMGAV